MLFVSDLNYTDFVMIVSLVHCVPMKLSGNVKRAKITSITGFLIRYLPLCFYVHSLITVLKRIFLRTKFDIYPFIVKQNSVFSPPCSLTAPN